MSLPNDIFGLQSVFTFIHSVLILVISIYTLLILRRVLRIYIKKTRHNIKQKSLIVEPKEDII